MAEIILPNRAIPIDIINEVRNYEAQGMQKFNLHRYEEARSSYVRILRLLTEKQTSISRPIHKGTPYHMIGLCYTLENQPNLGLKNIILAYIEDTLNVNYNLEDEADRAPAARMLRDYYQIQLRILTIIKNISKNIKESGAWNTLFDPTVILRRLEEREHIDTNNLVSLLIAPLPVIQARQPLGFPQPLENRVFIGGNYQTHMPVIRHIQTIVASLGFTPIIAFDVEMPRERTHDYTLLLLHTCKYAIFEISTPAGQLMEIERTRDYNVKTLLLYSQIENGGTPSNYVSSMLKTAGYQTEGYSEINDIDSIIRHFLQN